MTHRPGGVPILVYHSVSPDASWLPWSRNTSVRPETLHGHLKALQSAGWTFVSTGALIDARQTGIALPAKSVVLHFDDCYLDNYLFAAPILREFNAPAMLFVSTDFIAPGGATRHADAEKGPEAWQGYMNAAELLELDADPLFDIEAHGTNHARVPVSETVIGVITEENWKRHAPLSWALDVGDKSNWFASISAPSVLAVGDPLYETDSALSGRICRDGSTETEAEYKGRVQAMLNDAYSRLSQVLGRDPKIMAWPFDRCVDVAIVAAKTAGFTAVTGGRGENRADEDPTVLSRVHIQDFAFGGGPLWLEALAVRARTNSAAGLYGWHLLPALAGKLRRRKFGVSGYQQVP